MLSSRLLAFLLLITAVAGSARAQTEIKIQSGQKVAFLGDSITAQGWANPAGYVHLVVTGLALLKIDIVPIPVGISGNTSKDMLARLDRDVLSKSPDWMTLSCGVNDVWHGAKGVDLETYKTNITAIVDQAAAKGIKVIILTSTCIKEEDNPFNQKLVAYNDFLRQLAKDRNLPLADLSAMYGDALKANPPAPGTRLLTVDGVHPNHLGHMTMATGVLEAMGVPASDLPQIQAAWDAIPHSAHVDFGLGGKSLTSVMNLSDHGPL